MQNNEYMKRSAVGKKCGVCMVVIQSGDMVLIGQLTQKVFHQDCYEIVERHQQLAGMLQKGGIDKNTYEELLNDPNKTIYDYELIRK